MDHSYLHKRNPNYKSSDARKKKNVQRRSFMQKSKRGDVVNKQRDLSPLKENTHQSKEEGLKLKSRLQEWKKDRDHKKIMAKSKKKPLFKVGASIERKENHIYTVSTKIPQQVPGPSRNTRSKSRSKFSGKENFVPVVKKKRQAVTKDVAASRKKEQPVKMESAVTLSKRKSFAPAHFTFKAPEGLPLLDFDASIPNSMTSFIFNKDLTTNNFVNSTPSVSSSPKMKTRHLILTSSSSDEDLKVSKVKDANENNGVENFHKLLMIATKQLEESCKTWNHILETSESTLPKNAQLEIKSVIDEADTLLTSPLKKFKKIIYHHKSPASAENKVVRELKNFWDKINIKVIAMMKKFSRLEESRNKEWNAKENNTMNRQNKTNAKVSSARRRSSRLIVKEAKIAKLEKDSEEEIQRTPEKKKSKTTRFQLNESNADSPPSRLGYGSEKRSRSIRKTPMPRNLSCSPKDDEEEPSHGDIKASPNFRQSNKRINTPAVSASKDKTALPALQGIKLDFSGDDSDEKENKDSAIAAKYLTAVDEAGVVANTDCGGLDAKYLLPQGCVGGNETPVSSGEASVKSKSRKSTSRRRKSKRCSLMSPFLPAKKEKKTKQNDGNLIMFSPA